jgi:hypothetical protein
MQATRVHGPDRAVLGGQARGVVRVATGAQYEARRFFAHVTIRARGVPVLAEGEREHQIVLERVQRL